MKIGKLTIPTDRQEFMDQIVNSGKYLDVVFASGVLGIIAILILPIPPWFLDVLLTVSITLSAIILMTVLFIDKSLDFSSFPSILLVITMLRLALNISSTRLILANGHNGSSAAGHVIEAFGYFVMQGSVVIGFIVFGILTIINFVVITKGSGRIAEVAARFSLDAMPGKQMAIDADLSAGLIDEETAKSRRKELEDESTFYGAMDGANKFVRGDAIAGLLIIVINFVAGMVIGMVQKGMSFDDALQTYTLLTIGDGLVAQVPALVVSTSAGLLVTKSGVKGSAEKAIFDQLGSFPQALGVTTGLLVFMAIIPSIPAIPFLFSASITGGLTYLIHKNKQKASAVKKTQVSEKSEEEKAKEGKDSITEAMHIDIVKIEFGYELLTLINQATGNRIIDQIKSLRTQIAKDLGFVLPSVRIKDNMQIAPQAYEIKIKDIRCAGGSVRPNKMLAMDPRGGQIDLPGEDTVEPAFGLPAKWVESSLKDEATHKGYTVVDASTVITTHLTEVLKENITDLVTYAETQKLIDNLGEEHRKLVSDMIPSQITVTVLQRVLQGLLNEGVSIRDLATILEAISECAGSIKTVTGIIEHVRSRLAKQICYANTTENGYIPFIVISPEWEQILMESLVGSGEDKQLSLAPSKLQEFVLKINQEFEKCAANGEMPIILTSPSLRPYLRSIIERFRPSIVVMSQNEIYAKSKIKTMGQV